MEAQITSNKQIIFECKCGAQENICNKSELICSKCKIKYKFEFYSNGELSIMKEICKEYIGIRK